MKLFRDNKVYVQLKDLSKLTKVNYPIPANLYKKFLDSLDEGKYDWDKQKEFVSFDKEDEINTIRDFDWIIDFDEVKGYTLDDFQRLANAANNEANDIADIWNTLDSESKKLNIDKANRYELLHHKIGDIKEVLWTLQGHIKTPFPNNTNSKKK